MADAFLQGRFWLIDNPSWLSELIPIAQDKYYVVYPPLPAIVLMPLVLVFGTNFPQQYLAHFLGAALSVLVFKLSYLTKKDIKLALWISLTTGIGSIIWYLSSVGSVWYLGQISAAFFLTAALVESLSKKRTLLTGLFIGAAYLSRIHTILSLPVFIFLLKDKLKTRRDVLYFCLPILIFLGFNIWYNFVRYGVPYDKGYFLIPGTLSEPWFAKGILHPSYIIEDLKIAFWSFPKLLNEYPYIQPSWAGMSIWLTTPAFIFALLAPFKEKLVKNT